MTRDKAIPHDPKSKPVLSSGVLSDVTYTATNKSLLKNFMQKSKVLRFREKMENVKTWRDNSASFAAENKCSLENPLSNTNISEIDQKMIEQIEEEFDQHQKKMEQNARERAQDKDSDYNRRKR